MPPPGGGHGTEAGVVASVDKSARTNVGGNFADEAAADKSARTAVARERGTRPPPRTWPWNVQGGKVVPVNNAARTDVGGNFVDEAVARRGGRRRRLGHGRSRGSLPQRTRLLRRPWEMSPRTRPWGERELEQRPALRMGRGTATGCIASVDRTLSAEGSEGGTHRRELRGRLLEMSLRIKIRSRGEGKPRLWLQLRSQDCSGGRRLSMHGTAGRPQGMPLRTWPRRTALEVFAVEVERAPSLRRGHRMACGGRRFRERA